MNLKVKLFVYRARTFCTVLRYHITTNCMFGSLFFFSTVCDNCTRNVWNVHFGLDPMNNGHAPAIYDMRYFHIFVEYSMDVNVYSLPFSHTYIFIHRHKFYAA